MLGETRGTCYLVVHEGFEALNDFVLAPLVHLTLAGETGERGDRKSTRLNSSNL